MNYYKRHLGDYARDCGHLTALEHGIYTLLIDWYYVNERPIPDGRANRLARCTREQVMPILEEFFQPEGTVWRHSRIDREIAAYHTKAEQNRQTAEAREEARRAAKVERKVKVRSIDRVPVVHEMSSTGEPSHEPEASSHDKHSEEAAKTLAFDVFDCPETVNREAWGSWVRYRRGNRKPISEQAAIKQWPILAKLSLSQQAECISLSIRNDWRGLFPEKLQDSERRGQTTRQTTIAEDLHDRSWAAS